MKKALNLILIYFISLISALVVGTVLYSFYINVLHFIAGTEIQFFTKKEMLDAFFYTSFVVLIFICPLISYYKIRHPGGVPQLIAFILLGALTWAVAIPSVFTLSRKYIENTVYESKNISLSKGYFRQVDDKVYYFTKEFADKGNNTYKTTCVEIDTAEDGSIKIVDVIDSPSLPVNKAAKPYKEILVKNTFQQNQFPLSIDFKELFFDCNFHIQCGLMTFIGYLSLALVLCSVFGLTHVFKWKLLNTLLITCTTFLILLFNSNQGLLPFGAIETRFADSGFIRFFSKFSTHPLMVFTNFLTAIIFIVTGVVIFIVRSHKNKKRNR